ncbi:MAG: transcriptional repressor [Eubacterium sp.]|nr:transcriptional repressor [Eubacterium sp.]
MNQRSKYKTKQREILLDYLVTVPGEHITAGDVCEYFRRQGAPIGQSTIYRQLEKLVDEGVVNKYVIDSHSPACFEYIGEECHHGHEVCFHCKCERCGKLIHLHCEELEEFGVHLCKEHNFRMDPVRTVIYGVCAECADAKDKEPE